MNFTHALVRTPPLNFADGLTTAKLGAPDYTLALIQHAGYCQALQGCGLELVSLPPDPLFPDSTFVEDTAVLAGNSTVITHPGAPSRCGEEVAIREALTPFFTRFYTIQQPGTLEGGDICQAENHFFIGVSRRTNAEGAHQLAGFLAQEGFTSSFVDVTAAHFRLHLKSSLAYLGEGRIAALRSIADLPQFKGYEVIPVDDVESYAANCLLINGTILLPEGFPRFQETLERLTYRVQTLQVSEFRKMDGGLSCLSLRF
ncbi:MAG: arginine deiminase family protein [Chloroflexi bacterium]|nr:arginine deiminase family protein [Chloroflexota bacterium]